MQELFNKIVSQFGNSVEFPCVDKFHEVLLENDKCENNDQSFLFTALIEVIILRGQII